MTEFEEEIDKKFNGKIKLLEIQKQEGEYTKWAICECQAHGVFKKRLRDLLKSEYGCQKCGAENANKRYKKPYSYFLAEAKKVHGEKYEYPKFKDFYNNDKIEITCPKHGKFTQEISQHLNGHGCPECGFEKTANSRKFTTEEVIGKLKKKDYENYDYSKVVWENSDNKVEIICKKHGSFFIRCADFINGHGCPKCAVENRRKAEEEKFKKEMISKYGKDLIFPIDFCYVNSYTKVKLIYKGEEFFRSPHAFLKNPLLTKKDKDDNKFLRGVKKSQNRWKNILEELREIHSDNYEYDLHEIEKIKSGIFKRDDLMHIKCKKHGEFTQTFFDHRNGSGCRKCGIENRPITNVSKAEKEIVEFIKSIYAGEIITNDRKILNGKEVDIYIPGLNLAFEYDGVFWHNNVNNSYKFEECKKQGIRLIRITESEWVTKNNKIKNFIKSSFGCFEKKLYARKCEIKEIDNKTYKQFCEENHLQGYSAASIKVGLFYKNELVQVMSFSKPRFNKEIEWELVRECSKAGYSIIGGKGKLLKFFERIYKPKSLISYCEKDKFSGKSYYKNGFRLDKESQPSYNYFYKHDLTPLSRLKFQKHKLKEVLENFDENLTEWENMRNNGYMRLFDYGNYVFIKEYNYLQNKEIEV